MITCATLSRLLNATLCMTVVKGVHAKFKNSVCCLMYTIIVNFDSCYLLIIILDQNNTMIRLTSLSVSLCYNAGEDLDFCSLGEMVKNGGIEIN